MKLIINADDFNLTPAINDSIFKCFDEGVLTSTTVMMNLPLSQETVSRLKKYMPKLGVGVHLNITMGKPIVSAEKIPGLLSGEGVFKRPNHYQKLKPEQEEVLAEYRAQIDLFQETFGLKPTHLDTHHQLHDDPFFLKALLVMAEEANLPIRRSAFFERAKCFNPSCRRTDELWGSLDPNDFWTIKRFENKIQSSTANTVEVMCHPGQVDEELKLKSSMTQSREKDFEFLLNPKLKKLLNEHRVELIHYGALECHEV